MVVPSASAATYCVHSPAGCSGTTPAPDTIQQAIDDAGSTPLTTDTIQVGVAAMPAGGFVEGFSDPAGNPVSITGVGNPILAPSVPMLPPTLNEPSSAISSFTLLAAATPGGYALTLNGATGAGLTIGAQAPGTVTNQIGVNLYCGTLRDSTIAMPSTTDASSGVNAPFCSTPGAHGSIVGVTIDPANFAVYVGGGSVLADRLRIRARQGFAVSEPGASGRLSNSTVRVIGFGGVGLYAYNASGAGAASLTAIGDTVVGDGAVSQSGARAYCNGAGATVISQVTLKEVAVRGTPGSLTVDNGGTACSPSFPSVTYSAFDGAAADASITASATNLTTNADPLFVNEGLGDFALRAGSPLIDAGSPTPPAPGETDVVGGLRLVGSARDIGAYEFTPAAVLATPPASPPTSPPVGTLPGAAPPASITLAAAPNPVRFANFVGLSGRLTGGSIGGDTVTLQADPYPFSDNGFTDKTNGSTVANGSYSLVQAPRLNTRYRVVANTSPKVTSSVVSVAVAYRVGVSVNDLTPRRGTMVRFRGSVGPPRDGATVLIQRRRSDGRFVTVARATLRTSTPTRSVYSKRLMIRRRGTYRVHVSGDASHVAGNSPPRALTVH